jgi:hypothetical protein
MHWVHVLLHQSLSASQMQLAICHSRSFCFTQISHNTSRSDSNSDSVTELSAIIATSWLLVFFESLRMFVARADRPVVTGSWHVCERFRFNVWVVTLSIQIPCQLVQLVTHNWVRSFGINYDHDMALAMMFYGSWFHVCYRVERQMGCNDWKNRF